MQKVLIREGSIFFLILIILAGVLHPDLFVNPVNRFSLMQEKVNYYHPFIYTFFVYSILYLLRFFVKKITYVLHKILFKK